MQRKEQQLATDRAKLLQAIAERVERQAQEAASWQAKEKATRVLEDQAAMLVHAEQIRAAQQLTDELMRQTRHAARPTVTKPHHQHVQAQARHPAAAAAAVKRARRAAVIVAR